MHVSLLIFKIKLSSCPNLVFTLANGSAQAPQQKLRILGFQEKWCIGMRHTFYLLYSSSLILKYESYLKVRLSHSPYNGSNFKAQGSKKSNK